VHPRPFMRDDFDSVQEAGAEAGLDEMSDSEVSDFEGGVPTAELHDLISGYDGMQSGESLVQEEAARDAVEGTRHLLVDYNKGPITDDELFELVRQDRGAKRLIYPVHGTDGLLGNMHTSKVVLVVGLTGDEDGQGQRLNIRLKQETKCIQGLQGYNSSTRNDLRKQSRPSLDLMVKKLASLVSFYFTPYKTQAEMDRIPSVLHDIRATLRLLSEALEEQSLMAKRCHRRPVRLELFYNESAMDFFNEELLFPATNMSIAEGIVQVFQDQVFKFHEDVNKQVFEPLSYTFATNEEGPGPDPDTLDAEEKTYLAYAAEASAVIFGCFPADGPIYRSLRLNDWKSLLSFQPHQTLRLQTREQTFKWNGIPYRLKTCIRPCTFETGRRLDRINDQQLREKERRKLEQDIGLQMRNIVRIPFLFAKTKASILSLLHEHSGVTPPASTDDDSILYLNTPGLFDNIQFEVLVELGFAARRQFLEKAVECILVLYSEEWRDFLDGKLVRFLQYSDASNHRSSRRRNRRKRIDCILPPAIAMPVNWSGVSFMTSTHVASNHVVSRQLGLPITDAACKFTLSLFVLSHSSNSFPFLNLPLPYRFQHWQHLCFVIGATVPCSTNHSGK
jgi:hypothetical protein